MEVLKERDMKLLSRKRVTIMVDNKAGTPSRDQLIKDIAKEFKAPEENVIIKHAYPQFGKSKTKLIVHIYDDKDKIEMFENKNLVKKHNKNGEEGKQE